MEYTRNQALALLGRLLNSGHSCLYNQLNSLKADKLTQNLQEEQGNLELWTKRLHLRAQSLQYLIWAYSSLK